MQSEPIRHDMQNMQKESAAREFKSILPWFLIPAAIILVLLGVILLLPRNEAEAGQLIGQPVAIETSGMHSR